MRRFDPGTPCTECGKPTYCTRSGASCVEHWVTPEVDLAGAANVAPENTNTSKNPTDRRDTPPDITAAPLSTAEREVVRQANYRTNPRSAVFQGGAW